MRAIAILALAGALAPGLVAAQDRDFSKVEIKVSKVGGNVYMLQGAGGNIAASVGDDGIVIVDDQYAPLAEKIRAALKGITDKPLRFIINTHYHQDHTGGNAFFQKEAPIIAHDNVRKRLAASGTAGNGGTVKMTTEVAPAGALPILTFDHDVTVHLNGEDIRALHVPNGHTDGDSVIFFPKSNVVHLGDDFVTYGFPFVDLGGGGSAAGMAAALEEVLPKLPADVKVIPGHGPVSNLDDVRKFVAMIKETRAVVEKGVAAHKTLEQLQKEKVLAAWEKWSGDFVKTDVWIETLYNELTGEKGSGLRQHN
jgi:cyclase